MIERRPSVSEGLDQLTARLRRLEGNFMFAWRRTLVGCVAAITVLSILVVISTAIIRPPNALMVLVVLGASVLPFAGYIVDVSERKELRHRITAWKAMHSNVDFQLMTRIKQEQQQS